MACPFTRNIGNGDNWASTAEVLYQPSARFHVQVKRAVQPSEPRPIHGQPRWDDGQRAAGRPHANYNATAVYGMAAGRATAAAGSAPSRLCRAHLADLRQGLSTTGAYLNSQIFAELRHGRWSLSAILDNPGNSSADTFGLRKPVQPGETPPRSKPLAPRTSASTLSATF